MDRETESILILASRAMQFIVDHPYAATGLLGAAVGSAITYKVMEERQASGIFTPKKFEIILSDENLRHLQTDPTTELRWETPEVSVTIKAERPEPMKELPVIEYMEQGE